MPPRKRTAKAAAAPRRRPTKAERDAAAAAAYAVQLEGLRLLGRRVVELRRSGFSFPRLLAQPQMVHEGLEELRREELYELYELGVAETMPQPADQLRRLELDRLEAMIPPLYGKALQGDAAAAREVARLSKLRVDYSRMRGPADAGRTIGAAETATIAELEDLKVRDAALSASALMLARCVDEAGTETGLANAARELRMTMGTLRGLYGTGDGGQGKPLHEPEPEEEKPAADGTPATVSKLADLRSRSAGKGAGGSAGGKRGR